MLHDVFQDPRRPYSDPDGSGCTLQIHSPLPERVPIGHFSLERDGPIVDEVVSRAEYLDRIRQACAHHGETYTVRFYDHLDGFDASVLDELPEVRSLVLDPYCPIASPEAVGRLPNLSSLRFAPRGPTDPNVLATMGVERLVHFTLAETASPLLDLSPLGQAQSLRSLRLLAQGRNTDAIGNCGSLTELSMQPTERVPLAFVSRLSRLEVLKFSVGKIGSISAIESAPALRDLSFHWVHTLEDLGDLQRFPTLRRLQIEQQKRLKTLHVGRRNEALEHINAEGLDAIVGLSELPALKSLYVFNGKLTVEWSQLPSTLTHFALMPTSLKAREKHKEAVRSHGLVPELHPDASFFYK